MSENVKCPVCDGPMTSRKNRSTEQRFWGCNDYPKCRGTRNTDGEAPRKDGMRQVEPDRDGEEAPSVRAQQNDQRRWESF